MRRRPVILGAAALLCAGTGPTVVDGARALSRALAAARGGERLVLAPGSYGALAVTAQRFAEPVTLAAENPAAPPVFTQVEIAGTTGLVLDGLSVLAAQHMPQALVRLEASDRITCANVRIFGRPPDGTPIRTPEFGLLATERCRDIRIIGGHIGGTRHGLALFGVERAEVEGLAFGDLGEDTIKLAEARTARIAHVTGPPRLWPGPKAHADFIQVQGAASEDLEIVGNVFAPGGHPVAQGIFVAGKGGHRRVRIAGNLLYLANANGIFVRGDEAIEIRANTVINSGSARGISRIAVEGRAEIADNVVTDKRVRAFGSNLVMQRLDPAGPNYLGAAFPGVIDLGDRAPRREDLTPMSGSIADGIGAVRWMSQ